MKTCSIQRLHELFRLDPDTGKVFRRAKGYGTARAGDCVGTPTNKGYLTVSVDSLAYRLHRIVYAMTHDRWPANQVDHINGVRDDNRPCNLREATSVENCRNRAGHGATGVKGVVRSARNGKYRATIKADGIRMSLGTFSELSDAAAAYRAAEIHHFGQFRKSP